MSMMLDFMPVGFSFTQNRALFRQSGSRTVASISQSEVVGRHFLDFLTTNAEAAAKQMEQAFFKGALAKN
ncbi:hypothetical protein [Rhizobium sp. CNPSo 3490]|uniref:hypothetical protein n=1 Tax=Rhizobium sp. CNPSo 3490 TaxID=3021407 RepID=UPI00254BB8F6|nr:hypothetical protein [Rhizobium sp. CNPSo 3490]MDK4736882.1 hypothetical protein [Rhizobium sp. CNPSo 3490]